MTAAIFIFIFMVFSCLIAGFRSSLDYFDDTDGHRARLKPDDDGALAAGRLRSRVHVDLQLPETVHIEPCEVIIIEGIMALWKKQLRDLMDLKIFVDADPDERLIRVIQRDTVERGRTTQMVLDRYRDVLKPMHEEFIEPTKRYADLIIPQGGENKQAIEIMRTYIIHRIKP